MNHKNVILVVEDEKSIREVLSLNLKMDGYDVIECVDGLSAIKMAKENKIHLIIMDVMMPKVDGISAAKEIKERRPEIPIIMLSALDKSDDRINGLKAGADDYVGKPFNYEELHLRIEKQLTKWSNDTGTAQEIAIGPHRINLISQCVVTGEQSKQLSSKEIHLLKYLYNHKNRVVSREELLSNVWGYDTIPNSRTVDNYVSSLRKTLSCEDDINGYIYAERGIGYKFILN